MADSQALAPASVTAAPAVRKSRANAREHFMQSNDIKIQAVMSLEYMAVRLDVDTFNIMHGVPSDSNAVTSESDLTMYQVYKRPSGATVQDREYNHIDKTLATDKWTKVTSLKPAVLFDYETVVANAYLNGGLDALLSGSSARKPTADGSLKWEWERYGLLYAVTIAVHRAAQNYCIGIERAVAAPFSLDELFDKDAIEAANAYVLALTGGEQLDSMLDFDAATVRPHLKTLRPQHPHTLSHCKPCCSCSFLMSFVVLHVWQIRALCMHERDLVGSVYDFYCMAQLPSFARGVEDLLSFLSLPHTLQFARDANSVCDAAYPSQWATVKADCIFTQGVVGVSMIDEDDEGDEGEQDVQDDASEATDEGGGSAAPKPKKQKRTEVAVQLGAVDLDKVEYLSGVIMRNTSSKRGVIIKNNAGQWIEDPKLQELLGWEVKSLKVNKPGGKQPKNVTVLKLVSARVTYKIDSEQTIELTLIGSTIFKLSYKGLQQVVENILSVLPKRQKPETTRFKTSLQQEAAKKAALRRKRSSGQGTKAMLAEKDTLIEVQRVEIERLTALLSEGDSISSRASLAGHTRACHTGMRATLDKVLAAFNKDTKQFTKAANAVGVDGPTDSSPENLTACAARIRDAVVPLAGP